MVTRPGTSAGQGLPERTQSYNPEDERENDFGFIGRVVQNEYAPCSKEYMEKANLTEPVIQWQLRMEALDYQRADGTPGIFSNGLNLRTKAGRDIKGPGSPPFELSVAFNGLGTPMTPDSSGAGPTGGVFRFQSHTVKMGPTLRKNMYLPVEYLGDDYVYTGEVHTLKSKDSDQGTSTRSAIAAAAELASQSDPEKARNLADIIDGRTREEARAVLKTHPAGHQVIFGQNVLVGFNPPKFALLNVLEDRGFVTISDGGIIAATTSPVSV